MGNRNLSDSQFPTEDWVSKRGNRYTVTTEPHAIVMRTADRQAGYITWSPSTGEVGNAQVSGPFRREGVATEMWRRAKAADPEIYHSDRLSNDAQAWIQGMEKNKSG